jgi:hypothetical protein
VTGTSAVVQPTSCVPLELPTTSRQKSLLYFCVLREYDKRTGIYIAPKLVRLRYSYRLIQCSHFDASCALSKKRRYCVGEVRAQNTSRVPNRGTLPLSSYLSRAGIRARCSKFIVICKGDPYLLVTCDPWQHAAIKPLLVINKYVRQVKK